MPRISVIIPNWNGLKHLDTCLSALRAQTFKDFETILVDNGSADASCEFIENNFPEVRLIKLEKNIGFGRAVNIGIKAAAGEIIALLNNDTEASPGWLEAGAAALDRYPEAGLIASRVMFMDRRDIIDSAGDLYTPWGAVFNRGHNKPHGPAYFVDCQVFGACASATFIRRATLDDTGLFDENFFAYYEDIDLSFRARLMGWTCVYCADAVIYHGYSGSTHGTSTKLGREEVYIHLTSVWLKNMPRRLLLKNILPGIAFHSALVIFWLIARIRGKALMPRVPLLRLLRSSLTQRREIMKRAKASPDDFLEYFLPLTLGKFINDELAERRKNARP